MVGEKKEKKNEREQNHIASPMGIANDGALSCTHQDNFCEVPCNPY